MKKILLLSSILIGLSAHAEFNVSNIKDNPNAIKKINGIKVQDFAGQNQNQNKVNKSVQGDTPAQGQSMPGGVVGDSPATPQGEPEINNVSKQQTTPQPQSFTPQNAPIPIPQNYLDMANGQTGQAQTASSGQTPPEPLKIKQMTLQDWNTSTIRELEEEGKKNAQQSYRNFRRGVQY